MRYKKIILLMTALVLIISLFFSACSGSADKSSDLETPDENTVMTKKPVEDTMDRDAVYTYHTEEIYVENGDVLIYGIAYIPDRDVRMPLVVFSHGLGDSHTGGIKYAEALAQKGFCVYTYDFCGGTAGGNKTTYRPTTAMSVMTEADDLSAVLSECENWDFVDNNNIFLMGESQGGAVSSVIACEQPDKVKGLILIYPAFCIPDMIHEAAGSLDELGDEFPMFGGYIMLGRTYAEDMWNYDFYTELPKYTGNVLLLHGDKDVVVDISYSDRASDVIRNCEYHVIEGAGHGFDEEQTELALSYIFEYLYNNFN